MDVGEEKQEAPVKKQVLRGTNTAQVIILVNGVVLTLVIFLFMSIFTQEIIRDEQSYIANQTVQNFVSVSQNYADTINTAAVMSSLGASAAAIRSELLKDEVLFRDFYGIFTAGRNGDKWVYNTLWKGDARKFDTIYAVLEKDDILMRRMTAYVKSSGVNESQPFAYTTFVNYGGQKLYLAFLARKISAATDAGYVIGFANMDNGFGVAFKNTSDYIDSVIVRSSEDTDAAWFYDVDEKLTAGDNFDSQEYLLEVWQKPLAVLITFNDAHNLYFLKHIPVFFGLVGFFLTISAAYYIRNNRTQAFRLSSMNMELENKNLELRSEIGERERLNRALRQAEKENRSIIDAVSDIIFETNIEGEILFLSASWRKVTGFDPEQFIGHDLFGLLHPQDQKQQKRDFELLIKGQRQAYRLFTRLRTADGTFRAVEIAMSMIRQDQNRNLRVVGTFTDVEERRRAERALGEAEKKYRTIVENAAGGIYQLTPEGIYLSANPAMARILGFDTPEQILREVRNAFDTIYVDEKGWRDIMDTLGDQADFYNHETEVMRKNGQRIWVSENIRAVKDENGAILYFEGSIEDVTKRKEFEIALVEAKMNSDLANRAKSEFLANMSHELRTPLNSIIGFSEIIKNEVFGPLEQKSYWEYAKHINESGQSLLRVINEILDISRIEAGDRQLNESIVDIEQVMGDCLDLLSGKIENNQMFVVNALRNVPRVVGEELAIKQIFMNLLSNAVKFTPSGGRLTLSYEVSSHGQLQVLVTDTGVGLTDEEIQKALSPFGQVDSELSRSGSGTGLGLTLVRALIKMHGGHLDLFSQKGVGTTASIVFPVDRVKMHKDEERKNESVASADVPAGADEDLSVRGVNARGEIDL